MYRIDISKRELYILLNCVSYSKAQIMDIHKRKEYQALFDKLINAPICVR